MNPEDRRDAVDAAGMVREQIAARGVRDPRVLDAMGRVPRAAFLPAEMKPHAFEDRPLPIGEGQTISQPYMVACMTELLALKPDDRVLEIGTGSGYQTAVLATLARHVVSIERHAPLAARAHAALRALGFQNVEVHAADGTLGWPPQAPYDAILVTAGGPSVPQALLRQLADSGRLVCPVGPREMQVLEVVERHGAHFTTREHTRCVFVPLVGSEGWPEDVA